MREFSDIAALAGAVGDKLGTSDWLLVDQDRVDRFAGATGDHQWIHVDPARAADGPYCRTIAHGYLTLSLLPVLVGGLYRVTSARMAVNYGLNKVRFPAPVPVGSRIRAVSELASVTSVEGGAQVVLRTTVECEAQPKPVCVAETVSRIYV